MMRKQLTDMLLYVRDVRNVIHNNMERSTKLYERTDLDENIKS